MNCGGRVRTLWKWLKLEEDVGTPWRRRGTMRGYSVPWELHSRIYPRMYRYAIHLFLEKYTMANTTIFRVPVLRPHPTSPTSRVSSISLIDMYEQHNWCKSCRLHNFAIDKSAGTGRPTLQPCFVIHKTSDRKPLLAHSVPNTTQG